MSQVSDSTYSQNATQRMQDSFDAERAESRANEEKNLKRTAQDAERAVASAKKEFNQRLESERAQAREEIRRLKEEAYDQTGKKSAKEIRSESDSTDDRVSSALAAQRQSQSREVHDLQEELDQYRNSSNDLASEKAKARKETISQNEQSNLDEKNRIIQGYERQIAKLKDHQEEMARHYDRRISESTFDANDNAQRQIKVQKSEFSKIFKDDLANRNRVEQSYQSEIDRLKAAHARSSNTLIDQTLVDRERVAKDKDQTYQKYIAEKDQRFLWESQEKDKKIAELQTTGDELKVSPYVVNKIHQAAEKRNFENLTEAQKVHDQNLHAEKIRDAEDRRELRRNFQDEVTALHRTSRKESDLGNRQMRDAYADLKNTNEVQLANAGEQKRNAVDRVYQQSAVALAEAQKDKQDALVEQRDEIHYQNENQLDEVKQSVRNQDREWFMKMNDLRRNYEGVLATERDAHEKTVREMRMDFDKKLRDQDRLGKRDVDDRVRSYEFQIQQQELSFKEKERFLTEHYETELDKMKRTNAHLLEKKS